MSNPSRHLSVLLAAVLLFSSISPTLRTTPFLFSADSRGSDDTTAVLTVLDLAPGLSLNLLSREQRQAPVAASLCAALPFTIVVAWRRLTCDGRNGPLPERALLLTPTFASYL